jgi:hypothetical protein
VNHRASLFVAALAVMLACQAPEPWGQLGPVSSGGPPAGAGVPRIAEPPDEGLRADAATCDEALAPGALYVSSGRGARLTPLDPDTLADLPGCARLERPPTGWSRISEDGATIASITSIQRPASPPFYTATVLVRDATTGEERSHFVPPGPIGGELRLSGDGQVLLVRGWYATWKPDVVDWYVVETASGEVRATLPPERDAYSHTFFVGKGSYLYRLIYRTSGFEPGASWPATSASKPGPWPTEILAHDLSAEGAVVRRLTLPTVRAGMWWSERTINGYRIPAQLIPGAALAPDGRRLALAHADGDGVTVVHLERLAVERSVTAARTPTLLERLGLGTRAAHAKGMDGIVRRARFAPDERALYVWGSETRMEENGRMTEQAEPLRVIDLERGVLVGELRTERPVQEILASPDGRSLYVGGHRTPDNPTPNAQPPYVLRRLVPTSLAVLAEREFPGFRRVLFGGSEAWVSPGGLLDAG